MWAPHDLDWLACATQFAGTLWFNWSTANAVRENLDAATADQRVWRPDAFGSIAFLVASGLACAAVRRDLVEGQPMPRVWWIGVVNLLGSVVFGVSAVAAYIVPATGDAWNAELSNLGTLVGAICFLVGAVCFCPHGGLRRSSPAQGDGPGIRSWDVRLMTLHVRDFIRESLDDSVFAGQDLATAMPKYRFPTEEIAARRRLPGRRRRAACSTATPARTWPRSARPGRNPR